MLQTYPMGYKKLCVNDVYDGRYRWGSREVGLVVDKFVKVQVRAGQTAVARYLRKPLQVPGTVLLEDKVTVADWNGTLDGGADVDGIDDALLDQRWRRGSTR